MKAAKTWCITGLMLVAGFSSVSCGKEEGPGGDGGPGVVVNGGGEGGEGGGGTIGRTNGGSAGTAGSGGSKPVVVTALGRACLSDAECSDAKAPGLKCVTATSTELGGSAPPKGLCSAPCTVVGPNADDECVAKYGGNGICYPFDNSGTGYCIEGCSFGMPDVGSMKCHSRPEFGCFPTFTSAAADAKSCTATTDCAPGKLCRSGVCKDVVAACLPACRGDVDCAKGMFCDQSYLSGACLPKEPKGLTLGQPCTVPAQGDPEPCLGFCADDDGDPGTSEGHCEATCAQDAPCGWNRTTQKFDGFCGFTYPNLSSGMMGGPGDIGFCAQSCNCSSECDAINKGSVCNDYGQPSISIYAGPGLCFAANQMFTEIKDCQGAGGAGGAGAGGESSGGSPSGGAGGAGGAP